MTQSEQMMVWLQQGRILQNGRNGMMMWLKDSNVFIEYNGMKIHGDGCEVTSDGITLYNLTDKGRTTIAEIECRPEDIIVRDEFLGRVFYYTHSPGYFLVLAKKSDVYTVLHFSDTMDDTDTTIGSFTGEQLCDMWYKKDTIRGMDTDGGIEIVSQLIKRMAVDV